MLTLSGKSLRFCPRCLDSCESCDEIGLNILGANADYAVPGGFEHALALGIGGTLKGVNTAVNLDDQPLFSAEKIGNKPPNRLLATKFAPIKLLAAQRLPQAIFTGRRRFAKFLGCVKQRVVECW